MFSTELNRLDGGEKMDPKIEDYTDSTCVASTAGVMDKS
jgi:hypothetical protein